MKKILITSLLCNIILTQAMTGLELAEKINNKPEPKDSKSLILMDLINLKRNKTRTSEMVSISKDNGGKLKPSLVIPYVITTKKEQTVEQAIRLTKVEHANPSELIERIEKEEKTKSENDEN